MKIRSLCILLCTFWLAGCAAPQSGPAVPTATAFDSEVLHIVGEIERVTHEGEIITIEFAPSRTSSDLPVVVTANTQIRYEWGDPTTSTDFTEGIAIDVVGTARDDGMVEATDVIILDPTTTIIPTRESAVQPYPYPAP